MISTQLLSPLWQGRWFPHFIDSRMLITLVSKAQASSFTLALRRSQMAASLFSQTFPSRLRAISALDSVSSRWGSMLAYLLRKEPGTDLNFRTRVSYIKSVTSAPFTGQYHLQWYLVATCSQISVFTPRAFPGMSESTFLSRSFGDQGVKLRIRKEPRVLGYHLWLVLTLLF